MRSRRILATLMVLATLAAVPGCTPPEDIAYVEDENARLKQLLIQYENDARNNRVMMQDADARVQRVNLELEAANRKIGVYEQEIPRLRNLAVQAAQSAQSANAAQYQQYQQYINYMNAMNKNRGTSQGVLRQDLAQQLSQLADQFGGVVVGNRIELPGDFFFDSGRYDLNPNARAAIRRMAEILAGENLSLMVVGYTDNDPIRNPSLRQKGITDNLHLSLLRAKAVVDELKKAGYPPLLMYPTGWGELRPIVPNKDRASKKLNRRVDILIDPVASQTFGMSEITGVEPVASASAEATNILPTAEPMATTYTQSYSTTTSTTPTTTTTEMVPVQPYETSTSYSTIETIEPVSTGVTDLTQSTYSTTTYTSTPSTTTYTSTPQPMYSAPQTTYAVPQQPTTYSVPAQPVYTSPQPAYPAPQPYGQMQPYGAPQPYAQPQPYAPQQYTTPAPTYSDPYNPAPTYTTTLEPIAMVYR